MTSYQEYSMTEITRMNGTEDETFTAVTPILTVLKPNSADSELALQVNLNCLKAVSDEADSNSQGFKSRSSKLQVHKMGLLLLVCGLALQLFIKALDFGGSQGHRTQKAQLCCQRQMFLFVRHLATNRSFRFLNSLTMNLSAPIAQ